MENGVQASAAQDRLSKVVRASRRKEVAGNWVSLFDSARPKEALPVAICLSSPLLCPRLDPSFPLGVWHRSPQITFIISRILIR
eukprot:1161325-Pelagomonas_calceolata.AAC.3